MAGALNGVALAAATLALAAAAPVGAVCVADASGTSVVNPDDPACRDVMLTYTRGDSSGDNIALGYPVPAPVDSLTAVDGFRRYDSLLARHQDLALTEATVTAFAVGSTRAGRTVWAYRLGDADQRKPDGTAEAAVLLNGTIHAREWQSPEGVTEVFEQLVEIAADGGWGQYLADSLSVILLPVLNVDGFLVTQAFPDRAGASPDQPREGRMRRKNLHHPNRGAPVDEDLATTDDNFFGVDLNRNSARGFGLNQGSLGDVYSLVYRGPSAASEPEIQALLAAADLGPANRLRMYTDLHSFTQIFLAPQTGNSRRDTLTRNLATGMRGATGNTYRYSADTAGSGGIGTTADYFAYALDIPAWTLETEPTNGGQDYGGSGAAGSGFVLPDTEVARMRDELARMLLLGFYRQSGPPAVVSAQIRRTGDDAVVYDAAWQTEPDGLSRRLVLAVDEGLQPGTEYSLWLAFDKPMRHRNDQGAVTDYPGQGVSIQPELILAIPGLGAAGTDIAIDTVEWLDQPGGAPAGYRRYRDDAVAARFSLPPGPTPGDPVAAVLQVTAADMARQSLDGDPATPVDWASGHWQGYEDALGVAADTGGADCSFQPWVGTPGAAPPASDALCPAARVVPPPPPPPAPAPAPSPGGSGGGGAVLWLLLVPAIRGLRRALITRSAGHHPQVPRP